MSASKNCMWLILDIILLMVAIFYLNSFFNQSVETEHKNFLISIDIDSFNSILQNGWKVQLDDYSNQIEDIQRNIDAQLLKTFSLSGKFNVGKSFIIQFLSGIKLNQGDTYHTKGIQLFKPDQENIVFLDIQGEKSPAKDDVESLLERRLTDQFINEVISESSMVHMYVVNRLDANDQEFLLKLRTEKKLQQHSQKNYVPPIFVIHNLRGIKKIEDSKTALKRDILDTFQNAEIKHDQSTGSTYFTSDGMIHFILAEEGSEAGNKYNSLTKQLILKQVKIVEDKIQAKFNFFSNLVENMSQKLEKYLYQEEKYIQAQPVKNNEQKSLFGQLSNLFKKEDQNKDLVMRWNTQLNFDKYHTQNQGFHHRIYLLNSKSYKKRYNLDEMLDFPQFDNQFVPNIQTIHQENKFIIEIELLDAQDNTKYRVLPNIVEIEGQRICKSTSKKFNFDQKIDRKCGKFRIEKTAPQGFHFDLNKHKNKQFSPLKGVDEECKNGSCIFSFLLKKFESIQEL